MFWLIFAALLAEPTPKERYEEVVKQMQQETFDRAKERADQAATIVARLKRSRVSRVILKSAAEDREVAGGWLVSTADDGRSYYQFRRADQLKSARDKWAREAETLAEYVDRFWDAPPDKRPMLRFGRIDDQKMVGSVGHLVGAVKLVQTVDDQTTIVMFSTPKLPPFTTAEPFILAGFDTKQLPDSKSVKLDVAFEISGTDTYKNLLGRDRTVFVLKPIDLGN